MWADSEDGSREQDGGETRQIWLLPGIKTKLSGRSPQAKYTDRATASCRQSYCQPLRVECVAWWAQRIPTFVNLGFLDRNRYFFIQVTHQLSSRVWVDPVPHPLLLRKSGRAGNRTRDLWICSQKLWSLDHRGGLPEINNNNNNNNNNKLVSGFVSYMWGWGRAIAQAVSLWLSTAAARVQTQV
jgi:hypothetical protein